MSKNSKQKNKQKRISKSGISNEYFGNEEFSDIFGNDGSDDAYESERAAEPKDVVYEPEKPIEIEPFNVVRTDINDSERESEFTLRRTVKKPTSPISGTRLGLNITPVDQKSDCYVVTDVKTSLRLGVIPKLKLADAWKKVALMEGADQANKIYTERNYNGFIKNIIPKIKRVTDGKADFINDFLALEEIDYEEYFVPDVNDLQKLLRSSIEDDIKHTARAKKLFKKIRRYKFRLPLEKSQGGAFSDHDAKILKEKGIKYLNEIRKLDILFLKNLFLEQDVLDMPKAINEAIRFDWERRKDRYFKVIPFILEFLTLVPVFVIGLMKKYTLIKDTQMTILIFSLIGVWCVALAFFIYGGFRAIRRRRKDHVKYRLFTGGVTFTFVVAMLYSGVIFALNTLYYERYDGYDDVFYYRDAGSDIAIAGLFDNTLEEYNVPTEIDGKTVVGIDHGAFRNSGTVTVELSDTCTYINKNAFKNCKELIQVTLDGSLKTIGEDAFFGCEKIETIDLKNTVELGKGAFGKCSALKNVYLGTSLTTIGANAFENCTECVTVSADGAEIENIGEYAFAGCSSLTSADILNKAVFIGKRAFNGCGSLKNVTINSALEEIGEEAFFDCTSLRSLVLPFTGKTEASNEGLHYILNAHASDFTIDLNRASKLSDGSFSNDSSLVTVVLGSGIKEVGANAFKGCENLKTAQFNNNKVKFGESAFADCGALNSVIGSADTEELPDNMFYACVNLSSCSLGSVKSIGSHCFDGCVKYEPGFSSVTYVGDYACRGMSLTSVTIVNSAKIGTGAFANCTNLKSVTYSGSIEYIPADIFSGCVNLQYVSGFENVKEVGDGAFNACKKLSSIPIDLDSGKLTKIGANAFNGCEKIVSLYVPDTVTFIGESAFDNCSSLKTVILPFIGSDFRSEEGFLYLFGTNTSIRTIDVKVDEMGEKAFTSATSVVELILRGNCTTIKKDQFSGMSSLESITLPASIKSIGKGAFSGVSSLTTVTLPEGIKELEEGVFTDCRSIQTINGVERLSKIGKRAFANCTQLVTVDLSNITEIGNDAFQNCSSLKTLNIGSKLTAIGDNAFYGCTSLANVPLETTSVSKLGKGAFELCTKLTSITLPYSLKEVPERAFCNCSVLVNIGFASEISKIGTEAFSGCISLSSLEIPDTVTKFEKEALKGLSCIVSVPFIGSSENSFFDGWTYLFGNNSKVFYVSITKATKVSTKDFRGSSVITVSMPNVEEIESMAFKGITTLTNVLLGSKLQKIGKQAFCECSSLNSLDIPEGVTELGDGFALRSGIKNVNIPSSVTRIPARAFEGCKSLVSVVVGSDVTEIGNYAFSESGLTEVSIDAESVGMFAFMNCLSLYSVSFGENVKSIGFGSFLLCNMLREVERPASLKDYDGYFGTANITTLKVTE